MHSSTLQEKIFDIIICVHNSPNHLRQCLTSISQSSSLEIFNIIIVDDFSDAVTKKVIKEFQTKYHNNIDVITNQLNLGYVKSANIGIKKSVSKNIVLVNSDVIVSNNWLEKFEEALKSDQTIGLISALSNHGANLTIRMPPGFDYIQMNDFIEKNTKKLYPDAMTVVGHCLLITRKVIEKIGLFDEIYSPAYTEETDYHFKAISKGFRAVVADDTYVYHKGEGSFKNRNTLLEEHLKIFFSRWGDQFKKLHAEYERKNELGYLRDQQTQLPLVENYFYKNHSYDVVFLLPSLAAGIGGIVTVVEIINGLIRSGIRANIAYLGKKRIDLDMLFEPIYYDGFKEFKIFPPKTKVLVATDNGTVNSIAKVAKSHSLQSAYFIQDYEGWFERSKLEFVKDTYKKILNKIVVSKWIQGMIKNNDHFDSTVINVGISSESFYKRNQIPRELVELKKKCKIIVLSLLSDYERRGSKYFIQAMKDILKTHDDIGFVFTQRSTSKLVDFVDPRMINLGMIHREKMPNFFSGCDVIVDSSLYHGFGLPGLEGMSCGLAGIFTDVNLSYAINEDNCLLIEPKNTEQLKSAILRLRDDPHLLSKLKKRSRETALNYDWDKIIPHYVEYFKNLIALFDPNKSRPDFGYEKIMKYKDILKIIESSNIIQYPEPLTKDNVSPKKLLHNFSHYSKEFGFLAACKESIKWLFK